MRTLCFKIVCSHCPSDMITSLNKGIFNKIYREIDGTIRTVKSSLVFTNAKDAASFFYGYILRKSREIWIASADSVESRDWVFSPYAIKEMSLLSPQRRKDFFCHIDEKERPENILIDIPGPGNLQVSSIMDAPRGTALATNLKLEKRIMGLDSMRTHRFDLEALVDEFSKFFDEFKTGID